MAEGMNLYETVIVTSAKLGEEGHAKRLLRSAEVVFSDMETSTYSTSKLKTIRNREITYFQTIFGRCRLIGMPCINIPPPGCEKSGSKGLRSQR